MGCNWSCKRRLNLSLNFDVNVDQFRHASPLGSSATNGQFFWGARRRKGFAASKTNTTIIQLNLTINQAL